MDWKQQKKNPLKSLRFACSLTSSGLTQKGYLLVEKLSGFQKITLKTPALLPFLKQPHTKLPVHEELSVTLSALRLLVLRFVLGYQGYQEQEGSPSFIKLIFRKLVLSELGNLVISWSNEAEQMQVRLTFRKNFLISSSS